MSKDVILSSIETLSQLLRVEHIPGNPGFVKIRCPFHEETSGSCIVDLKKGIFTCFGCGTSGTDADLEAQINHLRGLDGETVRYLVPK